LLQLKQFNEHLLFRTLRTGLQGNPTAVAKTTKTERVAQVTLENARARKENMKNMFVLFGMISTLENKAPS
jgi:hypothetical protein